MGLLVTLLVVLTLNRQDLLDDIGQLVINYTEKSHQNAAKTISDKLLKGDIDGAIALFGEKPWQSVLPGDRGYRYKLALYKKLAEGLYWRKQYQSLFELSRIWHQHDDRNLDARAFLYESIRHLPGREEEGSAALEREFKKFPNHQLLTRFNHYAQLSSGATSEREILKQIASIHKESAKKSVEGWALELRWRAEHTALAQTLIEDYNSGRWGAIWRRLGDLWNFYLDWKENKTLYEQKQKTTFSIQPDEGGITKIIMHADPATTTTLRIDPPINRGLLLLVSDIRLNIDGVPTGHISKIIEYTNMFERDGYLRQSGIDIPRFYLKLGGLLDNHPQSTVRIELEFKTSLIDVLDNIRPITNTLIADNDKRTQ